MNNFTYWNPTRIHFGESQYRHIADEIPFGKKVMILYGGGSIKSNGVYDQVKSALKNFEVTEFGGIEPNPHYETLMKAVAEVKASKIDYLLAVGGGSVIDGTKFIAAAAKCASDPWEIWQRKSEMTEALPFGAVLTLAATGSEMNMFSVVTKAETKEKIGFGHPLLYPKFAILDVVATYSVPKKQIANGIVDAFTHVMEQYLTYAVNAHVQDRWAEGILKTLTEDGPKAIKTPHDYDVRSNLMWAATAALNGVIGVGVPQDWATHMIGHELTAEFGMDHAQTLAVVLPATMERMQEQKQEKILQYGERIWNIKSGTTAEKINFAIDETRSFFESLGVDTRLSDYGVNKSQLPPLVERLKQKGLVALGEKQNITPDVALEILELSL